MKQEVRQTKTPRQDIPHRSVTYSDMVCICHDGLYSVFIFCLLILKHFCILFIHVSISGGLLSLLCHCFCRCHKCCLCVCKQPILLNCNQIYPQVQIKWPRLTYLNLSKLRQSLMLLSKLYFESLYKTYLTAKWEHTFHAYRWGNTRSHL